MNHVVGEDYSGETTDVQVLSLDEYRSSVAHAAEAAELWKVDVEGFEPQVPGGATESLGSATVEAVFLEAESVELAETMLANGFARLRMTATSDIC